MAGKSKVHPHLGHGSRGPIGGVPRPCLPLGPSGLRPMEPPDLDTFPTASMVEEKLALQHAEIQRLLTEIQNLAAVHMALRHELMAAQQENQKLREVADGMQVEKEQQFRGLFEKLASMQAEMQAVEPLKADLQRAQADAQKLLVDRQELSAQIQQLNLEVHKSRTDTQGTAFKSETEILRQEVQRARTAFEFEKKTNAELLEQRNAMEKNLVQMAREVEKLRAELAAAEKKTQVAGAAGYGGPFGSESAYPSVPLFGDRYSMNQISGAIENNIPFGAGWGAYGDMQRGNGMSQTRR